ncbi:hypothetical protein [Lysobacter gummosus]|uniref:hypothetical protein n=1 Tax=Lysobacter gummosus TaxID=262324 RepID=UPI00362E5649
MRTGKGGGHVDPLLMGQPVGELSGRRGRRSRSSGRAAARLGYLSPTRLFCPA